MNLTLKRINKLTELVPGKTYLLFNNDIESSIDKNRNNSCTNIKILDAKPMLAVAKVDINDQILIRQDMLRNLLYIYDLDSKSENTDTTNTVELKRRIRKLEKKNAILNKLIRKNGIELIQHKQLKKQKKKEKLMVVKDIFTDSIFGYQTYVVIKTNNIDKVQVSLTIQPGVNLINDTVVQHKMIVNGIAIKHKDDNFSYELGKQLAYSRAINKLMERILQD